MEDSAWQLIPTRPRSQLSEQLAKDPDWLRNVTNMHDDDEKESQEKKEISLSMGKMEVSI